MKRIIIIETIFFLYVTSFCFADNIYLKNGNVIEGKVIKEEKDRLVIEIEGGAVTFYRNEIASIEIKDFDQPKLIKTSSDKVESLSEGVAINIVIGNIENKLPIIKGTTNLPNGTQLLITLSSSDRSYFGQDKTTVKQGKFQAGPFSRNNNALLNGNYIVEIVMPIAKVQPEDVQAVIGTRGERLTGPLVEEDSSGLGKLVRASKKFVIGESVNTETKTEESKRLLFYLERFKSLKSQIERMYAEALNRSQGGIQNWNREYTKFKRDLQTLNESFDTEFGQTINEYSGSFRRVWFYISVSGKQILQYLIDLNSELDPQLKNMKIDIDYFKQEIEENLGNADSALSGFKD